MQFLLFLAVGIGFYQLMVHGLFTVPAGTTSDKVFALFLASDMMPIGLRGLIVAAVFAAAMSTLSASWNSAASTVVYDFYQPLRKQQSEKHYLQVAKLVTLLAGLLQMGIALLAIQGPRSKDFLKSIVQGVDLDSLKFFYFQQVTLNETELLISRSGYTGELGYELYVPSEEAAVLWEYLIRIGKDFGLRPYGTATMQSLRIEKALPLAGPDIPTDESRTPFHLGLDRWVRFDKHDFVGRDALLRVQEKGINERWVGLTLESDIAARPGSRILAVADFAPQRKQRKTGERTGDPIEQKTQGTQVGVVTSSAKGHSVGKMLALAYVQTTHAYTGCQLMIEVEGEARPTKVVPTPFFDPAGTRLRGSKTK